MEKGKILEGELWLVLVKGRDRAKALAQGQKADRIVSGLGEEVQARW